MFDTELLDRIRGASRAEARAAADRLVAVGELFAARLRESGETEDWAVDTQEAVTSEIAAALCVSQAMAGSYVRYARALREQLPLVGSAFVNGDIDFHTFQTLVYRTDLITDPDVLASVDAELAVAVPRWPSMSRSRRAARIDRIVERHDRDAVRRRVRDLGSDRDIWIGGNDSGYSEVHGTLHTTDAMALDRRLDALSATVCDADPRTPQQRRSDAVGALAAGADRLSCACGLPECPAGGAMAGAVVIHVVAEQGTVDGTADTPAEVIGADGLIAAEVIAELAKSARQRFLVHPGDAPAEAGYRPSLALADFVRYRDLTCRFPGCAVPATKCDLDHTVPYGDGGPTHASNLKCQCRLHHLIKTFWGWQDRQLCDGTIVWTSPSGQVYVTTPGSALLFPALCVPTGAVELPDRADSVEDRCGERTAMMPTRSRTRAQNRAARIAAERAQNRADRITPCTFGRIHFTADVDPPPF